MSERKVLQKYYPPDFDPSAIKRVRGAKNAGPKLQPVRLMAPFSMCCTSCGEYISIRSKFNARKETTDEKYLNIPIYRFYIRCKRCSGEITFRTDPKGMDYTCERGAKRNFEAWRPADAKVETDDERLERLEEEEAAQDAMGALETKMHDAATEMQIADALDEIRTRNALRARAEKDGGVALGPARDGDGEEDRARLEREDEEAARLAFRREAERVQLLGEEPIEDDEPADEAGPSEAAASLLEEDKKTGLMAPPPSFKKGVKRKKDFSAALGIKKKPALV